MEKLMKPAEYAQEIGISRQAVYAKIKRGILATKDVEGKLYIVVDTLKKETQSNSSKEISAEPKASSSVKTTSLANATDLKKYKALLQAKDETISVLKGTVKDLKKSNKQISTTLRGEINLLKDAFHEMRKLYVHQLEHKNTQGLPIDVVFEEQEAQEEKPQWVGIKKFLKQQNVREEKDKEKLVKLFKKAYKAGDMRFKKIEGKLRLDTQKSYSDMV